MKKEIVILGAGFAGIGAGLKYGRDNTVIFEKKKTWGGLCGNFVVEDFRFDYAVHLLFANNEIVNNYFNKIPQIKHRPEAMNYSQGRWIRHPVQNNLRQLPVKERIRIIEGFVSRKTSFDCSNYEEWLQCQFGDYFSKHYSEKYTKKYWGTEAKKMSCSWIKNRVYCSSLTELLEGAFIDAEKSKNVYYAKEMYYPKNGGYKQFLSDIANDLNICYDYDAVRIDSKNKKVYFANGETCNYETLISTIPLPDLAKMLDVSSNVKKAAENLKSTSILLISVGFNKNIEFPSLWFYVYDENIPFARVHSPSMKSPQNSPLGCSSLQFEIYFSLEHPLKFSTDELVKKTLDCMEKMKLAKRSDIKILDYRYVLHANVIYYKNMEVYRDFVKKAIQSKGIKLCGRFGEWEYLWSYQSFLSGYNVT